MPWTDPRCCAGHEISLKGLYHSVALPQGLPHSPGPLLSPQAGQPQVSPLEEGQELVGLVHTCTSQLPSLLWSKSEAPQPGSLEGSQWMKSQQAIVTHHQSTHSLAVSPILSLLLLGVTSQINSPHLILSLGLSFREIQTKALDGN